MSKRDFDLFVLGAGSGGVAASRRAALHGARVAIAEDREPGGTCVVRGCVPKKLFVYASAFAGELEVAKAFGWDASATVDWPRFVAAKQAEVRRLSGVYTRLLHDGGVALVQGRGTIVDAHTVRVEDREYTTERILVATGGRPWMPGIVGAELCMSSDEALDRTTLPRHVTIVGGGYIGVEFAGIYRTAGCDVTMLVRDHGILRGFDDDIRTHLAEHMRAAGIEIREHAVVESVAEDGELLRVRLQSGAAIATDAVMFATGRVPNTEGIGLAEIGVVLDDRGRIVVDDSSRTSVPSVFAIGDVTSRPALTPMAIADGRAFADTEFGGRPRTASHEGVATAVFSQPPCGTCGLTEAAARERGPVKIYRTRFRPMKHAFAGKTGTSMMKLVVDATTDRVLGVHIVGPDAPEIVQGFAVAVVCGATKAQFDATLAIHPTSAEELVLMTNPVAEH
jgi:glutathione reductase (NADPH)